jgi:hypothetical protein
LYEALKARFLHSGRGRPKALPKDVIVNNKLLVQLAYLSEEGNKSRTEVGADGLFMCIAIIGIGWDWDRITCPCVSGFIFCNYIYFLIILYEKG